MNPIFLNGTIAALELRLLTMEKGTWIADVDVALGPLDVLPTGRATVTVDAQTLMGTVDPIGSGRFAEHSTVRVIGGANGWGSPVPSKDFHNDAQVTAADVIGETALEVGEVVTDLPVLALAVDYLRSAGAAARVLAGFDWYVDRAGVTHVTKRLTTTPTDDVQVLSYDPLTRRLQLAADTVLEPGLVITDSRFGTVTVRDVEQTFSPTSGSRATAWCGDNSQGVTELLRGFIVEVTALPFLKRHGYRIVKQGGDGRLDLQAIKPAAGLPDAILVSSWMGVPGVTAKFNVVLGSVVELVFLEGDPSKPRVVGYDPVIVPLELHFDATTLIELGAGAPSYAAQATKVDAINTAASTLATANSTFAAALSTFAGFCTGPTPMQLGALTAAATAFEAAVVTFNATVTSVAALLTKVK